MIGIVEPAFEQVARGPDASEGRAYTEARKLFVSSLLDVDLFVSSREFAVVAERAQAGSRALAGALDARI